MSCKGGCSEWVAGKVGVKRAGSGGQRGREEVKKKEKIIKTQ